MTLRQYLFWMLLSTGLCWIGWFVVLQAIDPASAGLFGFVLFYATLGLSLIGTFAVMGLTARALLRRQEAISRHVAVAFRQSLLLACLLIAALMLQGRGLLTWWNLLLLAATLTVLEFFLTSFRRRA